MNVIGLGKAGCKIAEGFEQHPQYTVFKIDADKSYKRKKNCFFVPPQPAVEMYDASPLDLKKLVESLEPDDEVLFIVCGSGKIAGCTLWILQQLREREVNIAYICPDITTLDNKAKLRHRAHYHILQEYARSGVFKRIFLLDNNSISKIVGSTSVLQYYSKINDFILNIFHARNVYINNDSVFDTFQDDLITTRISTFSLVDMQEQKEKNFFDIKNVHQIKYFYGFNRTTIENDDSLLDKIVKISTAQATDDTITSYGIYESQYEVGYCFAVKSTAIIQQME